LFFYHPKNLGWASEAALAVPFWEHSNAPHA